MNPPTHIDGREVAAVTADGEIIYFEDRLEPTYEPISDTASTKKPGPQIYKGRLSD